MNSVLEDQAEPRVTSEEKAMWRVCLCAVSYWRQWLMLGQRATFPTDLQHFVNNTSKSISILWTTGCLTRKSLVFTTFRASARCITRQTIAWNGMTQTSDTIAFDWFMLCIDYFRPSVLWRCWLGGRKGIRPVKTEWWGAGVVIHLERGANDLHMVQLMPLPPHHLLLQQNPEWFTFLVPAHPRCSGKMPLNGCCSSSSSGSSSSR